MDLAESDFEKLRARIRFKVCYDVGFFCADVDDIVQETLARFLVASREQKIHNPESAGAFINGICRNVVSEYRRKNSRNDPIPEVLPPALVKTPPPFEPFELRQAIAHGLAQLSERDRKVLSAFYLEEKPKAEILNQMEMTEQNFRVVLCRAKERFRAIYLQQTQHWQGQRH